MVPAEAVSPTVSVTKVKRIGAIVATAPKVDEWRDVGRRLVGRDVGGRVGPAPLSA